MAVTVPSFRQGFEEFRSADDATVAAKLEDAQLQVNVSVWGAKADVGIRYLTAHLLSLAPSGENAKLRPADMGKTAYLVEFNRVLRQVTFGLRTAGLSEGVAVTVSGVTSSALLAELEALQIQVGINTTAIAANVVALGNAGDFTNTLWVDGGTTVATVSQDGSSLRPYKTMQQVLDFVPKATDGPTSRNVWTAFVLAGTYDEDLSWDVQGRRIRLVCVGPVNLGLFDDTTWQPTAEAPATAGRRHITIFGDGDNVADNIRSYVSITAMTWGLAQGAVNNSFNAFRISGQILVTATTTGSAGNIDWDLQCEIYGTTGDETGVSFDATLNNPNMTINMKHMRCRGAVNSGTDGSLSKCIDVGFQGHLDIEGYLQLQDCEIEQGISILDAAFVTNSFPTGFYNCSLFGELITATPNTKFEIDAITYQKMIENSFVLPSDINLIIKGVAPTTTNTLWVDGGTAAAAEYQDGSRERPYGTIQQALDFIPKATDGPTSRVVWTVYIAAGTYDEDLSWDVEGRRIRLVADGPVNLGLFDSDTWKPTAPDGQASGRRHITVFGDGDNIADNIRDYVSIQSMFQGNTDGLVANSFSLFRISGQILVTASTTGNAGNIEWDLVGVETWGTLGDDTGVAFDATLNNPNMTMKWSRCNMRGSVDTGTDARLADADEVRFQAHVATESVSRWIDCEIPDGLAVVDQMSSSNSFKRGLFNCIFQGEFTSAQSNPRMRVDYSTYKSMVEGSLILPTDVDLQIHGPASVVLFAGGGAPTTGQFYEYSAPASGSAGAAGSSRQTTLPNAVKLFTLVWDTTAADGTTELAIRVAGSVVKTVTLDGSSGSLDLISFAPAGLFQTTAGDTISVEYTGVGTAPGAGTVKVLGL